MYKRQGKDPDSLMEKEKGEGGPKMKVLIVGSGGREHAIAYSVAKSEKVDKIYCTPGNAGIAEYAECAPIGPMEFSKITAFAKEKEIDLVIVGMDLSLIHILLWRHRQQAVRLRPQGRSGPVPG